MTGWFSIPWQAFRNLCLLQKCHLVAQCDVSYKLLLLRRHRPVNCDTETSHFLPDGTTALMHPHPGSSSLGLACGSRQIPRSRCWCPLSSEQHSGPMPHHHVFFPFCFLFIFPCCYLCCCCVLPLCLVLLLFFIFFLSIFFSIFFWCSCFLVWNLLWAQSQIYPLALPLCFCALRWRSRLCQSS